MTDHDCSTVHRLSLSDPTPTAKCGRTDPHGAHPLYPTGFCAGNLNIITAQEAPAADVVTVSVGDPTWSNLNDPGTLHDQTVTFLAPLANGRLSPFTIDAESPGRRAAVITFLTAHGIDAR